MDTLRLRSGRTGKGGRDHENHVICLRAPPSLPWPKPSGMHWMGDSTLIPHHEPETEDEIMNILDSCGMTVRHNQPLLLELLDEEHTTKSL
jgi:hypothetical protein